MGQSLSAAWYDTRLAIASFTLRAWLVALTGAVGTLVALAIPTAIIRISLFTRMTPVRFQDYVLWILSAILSGLIAGTFVLKGAATNEGKALTGLGFADLAIGCPICNKIVVALIGVSGALRYFAPFQVILGIAALLFLAWALALRARSLVAGCDLISRGRGTALIDGL
jgi:hypothetical protein